MNKTQRILLIALALVGTAMLALFLRNPQPPVLPVNDDHRWVNSETCLECHGVGRPLARPDDHPIGNDCLRCHGVSK